MSKALVRFWKSKLDSYRWLMDPTTRAMIAETIAQLKDLERIRKMTRVEREAADILATKRTRPDESRANDCGHPDVKKEG